MSRNSLIALCLAASLVGCFDSNASYTLEVELWGDGVGVVSTDPPGVVCGERCRAGFPQGEEVTLIAVPGAGYHLDRIRGDEDCHDGVVTMTGPVTCTARFLPDDVDDPESHDGFQVRVDFRGQGTVALEPGEHECVDDCAPTFIVGTTVQLVATAAEGWTWAGWGGDPDCADGEVSGETYCEARFEMPEQIGYVSDSAGHWSNFEIFALDLVTGTREQLSFDPGIDNHPDISRFGEVVWASDRGNGEFDIYLSDIADLEGTARRLTFDEERRIPSPDRYADRHPHFDHDADHIVFTSKNRPHDVTEDEVVSECSVPIVVPTAGRYCEGMNVASRTGLGGWTITELDVHDADPGGLWPDPAEDVCTYVGHPGFSHDGTRILFTGSSSVDGGEAGTIWEVYSAGIELDGPDGPRLVPDSLVQHTDGPAVGPNPIQMTGGATWSADDSVIYFTSTRTEAGNSQLYAIPADAVGVSVADLEPLSAHAGNDYVPHAVHQSDDKLMMVSDLGDGPLCGDEATEGPTDDLDLVLFDLQTGHRQIFGTSAAQEMLMIGDEVSWFCGLSPNLSACRQLPRIKSGEALWLEARQQHLPRDLIQRFGYPDRALRMYAEGWRRTVEQLDAEGVGLGPVADTLAVLDGSGFPGLDAPWALEAWLETWDEARTRKHVVPSVMHEVGLGAEWPGCVIDLDLAGLPVGPLAPGTDLPMEVPHGRLRLHLGTDVEMSEYSDSDVAPYYEVVETDDGGRTLLVAGGFLRIDGSRVACDNQTVTVSATVTGQGATAVAMAWTGAVLDLGWLAPLEEVQDLSVSASPDPHIEALDVWTLGQAVIHTIELR